MFILLISYNLFKLNCYIVYINNDKKKNSLQYSLQLYKYLIRNNEVSKREQINFIYDIFIQ
jgi:hypothetical protein